MPPPYEGTQPSVEWRSSVQLEEKGLDISAEQLRHLFRVMKRYRKDYPGWTLVEVEGHDGDTVRIQV